jgi:hypothetical protein
MTRQFWITAVGAASVSLAAVAHSNVPKSIVLLETMTTGWGNTEINLITVHGKQFLIATNVTHGGIDIQQVPE